MFQRNRAAAGFDRTQNLQMGWLYELPFGKGKMLAKSGVAAAVLGGWQVNGIMSAYTGTPFTVGAPGSSLNAPNNTQTADQVNPTVARLGNVGPGQLYYDPTAFAAVDRRSLRLQRPQHPAQSGNLQHRPGHHALLPHQGAAQAPVPGAVLQPREHVALRRGKHAA